MEWILILGAIALLGGKKTPAPATGSPITPAGPDGLRHEEVAPSDALPATSYTAIAQSILPTETLVNPFTPSPAPVMQLSAPTAPLILTQLAPGRGELYGQGSPMVPVVPGAQTQPSSSRGVIVGNPSTSPAASSSYESVAFPGFTAPASAVGPVRMLVASSVTQTGV